MEGEFEFLRFIETFFQISDLEFLLEFLLVAPVFVFVFSLNLFVSLFAPSLPSFYLSHSFL